MLNIEIKTIGKNINIEDDLQNQRPSNISGFIESNTKGKLIYESERADRRTDIGSN